jgi:hypothetical protein
MFGFVPQPNLRKASNYRELISRGETQHFRSRGPIYRGRFLGNFPAHRSRDKLADHDHAEYGQQHQGDFLPQMILVLDHFFLDSVPKSHY